MLVVLELTNFKYVIDSSVIIRRSTFRRYDMESFPHQWKNFDDKVQEGLFVSTPQVKTEINAKNKELLNWADENDIMFNVDLIDQKVVDAAKLLSEKFPLWYNSNEDEDKPWADPEIIAFAKAHNIVIVTQENWDKDVAEQNYNIPLVCAKLGAYCHIKDEYTSGIDKNTPFQCIDFVELIKREKLYL